MEEQADPRMGVGWGRFPGLCLCYPKSICQYHTILGVTQQGIWCQVSCSYGQPLRQVLVGSLSRFGGPPLVGHLQ